MTEVIEYDGDMILLIEDQPQGISHRFRCKRSSLRANSHYLNVLLDPEKFLEGVSTQESLSDLHRRYPSIQSVPEQDLPVVRISDLPNVSAKPSALKQVLVIV